MSQAYLSYPTIMGSKIAFVSEDDLWLDDLDVDAPATRITTSDGVIRNPIFDAEANIIAYTSNEFGSNEIYTFNLKTGTHKRLTHFGANSIVRDWDYENNRIIFSSNYGHPHRRNQLYSIDPEGGAPELLPYGLAISYHSSGDAIVLGRFQEDNARWKRYQGGTAGQIWIAEDGKNFELLDLPNGNHVSPLLLDNKIYFLSDYEGPGNLYRCNFDGSGLEQLTNTDDYYFRRSRTDGTSIIMQKGGSLYVYTPSDDELKELDITYISSREKTKEKFVEASKYLHDVEINSDDTHVMIITRGKPFYFPFWEEGTYQLGKRHGVRYKLPTFHPEENKVLLVSDEMGEDRIEIFDLDDIESDPEYLGPEIGLPYRMKISPDGNYLAVFNNRFQVVLVDLNDKSSKVIHSPEHMSFTELDWSKDSRWLLFNISPRENANQLIIYDVEEEVTHAITSGDFGDRQAKFSPDGKYIYFLSNRAFQPLQNPLIFQYDFPKPIKIYGIALTKETEPSIKQKPRPLSEGKGKSNEKKDNDNDSSSQDSEDDNNESDDTNGENDEEKVVHIDFDGIMDRIFELPVDANRINSLDVAKDRILYVTIPVDGMKRSNLFGPSKPKNKLHAFKFKDLETEVVAQGINNVSLSDSKEIMVVRQGPKVRLLPATHSMKKDKGNSGNSGPNRKSKYLNLNRIKLKVDPHSEWSQMIKETWKLMKDHYYDENLAGINWERILDKYLQLVDKISSRAELSDLLWTMQAESKTSHSYEGGGDYDFPPNYAPAYLGADFKYADNGYEITTIHKGDTWSDIGSPLVMPGIDVSVGDKILSVDGIKVSKSETVQKLLMGKAGQEIYLKIKKKDESEAKTYAVKPMASDAPVRYRDWVEKKRRYVHDKSEGKIGYFHIPDMFFNGLQEFYRYFKLESEYDGLIVDVRFNGGGHTSQLFLEKLARKRLGYNISRYGSPTPYPDHTVPGPMVAVTNQHAGSDGDIFSHSFKMLNLGPLVGTRTWGGVVGIWPKISLVDGSMVTQPEFAFWFKDVGYNVENYGTDPDIEVDITPNDYMVSEDPQLDKAIEIAMNDLEEHPVEKPDLDIKPTKT